MTKRRARRPKDEIRHRGEDLDRDTPNWDPLEALVGLPLVGHFMWMGAVQLVDGPEVQIYKHRWTRRSMHVAADNRCFCFDWDGETIPGLEDWPSEYVQMRRFSMLVAVFDWSGMRDRPWSDERTDRLIQAALGNALDGKAYLVRPHGLDATDWAELEELGPRDRRAA